VSSHETVLIMFQRVEFVPIMRIVCIIFWGRYCEDMANTVLTSLCAEDCRERKSFLFFFFFT